MKKQENFAGFTAIISLLIIIISISGLMHYFGSIAPSNQAFFDRHEIFSLPYTIIELFIGGIMLLQSIIINNYAKRDEYDTLNPMNEKPWNKYGRDEP